MSKSDEERKKLLYPYIYLAVGTVFSMFVLFRTFHHLFAWLAPIFLIRFTRTARSGWIAASAIIPMIGVVAFQIWGGWDMDVAFVVAVLFLFAILLIAPLLLDRLVRRLDIFPKIEWQCGVQTCRVRWFIDSPKPKTLVTQNGITTTFAPTLYVCIDYVIHLTPLGSVFSYGASQAENLVLLQLCAFGGLWMLTFLIYWTAIIVNECWEDEFDLKKAMKRPVVKIFVILFATAVLFGALRLAIDDPSTTVKTAGVVVPHARDYWTVIDKNTPPSSRAVYKPELDVMMNSLFSLSQTAANGGAKIIQWSEGNGVYYPEDEPAFLARASNFAKTNNVYFAPCVLKYLYNGTLSENKVLFFDRNGTLVFEYQKTISWYPSNSDGIIDVASTIYGRIAATICFDNDFPFFIHQVSQKNVDILLVPAFDTAVIKKFHGQTALLRAVENGVNIFRIVNKGISYATSYLGDIRASMDSFDTPTTEAGTLMYADIPMKRATTVFQYLGNWFMFVLLAEVGVVAIYWVYKVVDAHKKARSVAQGQGQGEDVGLDVVEDVEAQEAGGAPGSASADMEVAK